MALRNVLITGGTGFVGSATARALAEKHPDCAITIVDIRPPNSTHELPASITFIQADVTSPGEIEEVIAKVKPVVVIHTAGIVPILAERYGRRLQDLVWKINVEGTKNTLNAAKKAGVEAFVYTSSCCAVTDDMSASYQNIDEGWPTSRSSLIYGESKTAAEAIVLQESSPTFVTCALRPSVLCGPGDYQLIPSIHACIKKWETPFIIGDGSNLWDVTYVTNIADAHVLAAENLTTSKTAAGEAFFIQNNEPITFRDFCLAIWAHFGHIPPFQVRIPTSLAWVAGLISEYLTWMTGATTTLSRGSVRDACSVRYASGEKARKILGYEARVGMEDAIRLSCEVSTPKPTIVYVGQVPLIKVQDYARRLGVDLPNRPT